jgi:hypothetical protein
MGEGGERISSRGFALLGDFRVASDNRNFSEVMEPAMSTILTVIEALESPAHAGVGVALRRGMVRSFPDSIFGQGRSTIRTPGLFNHRIC